MELQFLTLNSAKRDSCATPNYTKVDNCTTADSGSIINPTGGYQIALKFLQWQRNVRTIIDCANRINASTIFANRIIPIGAAPMFPLIPIPLDDCPIEYEQQINKVIKTVNIGFVSFMISLPSFQNYYHKLTDNIKAFWRDRCHIHHKSMKPEAYTVWWPLCFPSSFSFQGFRSSPLRLHLCYRPLWSLLLHLRNLLLGEVSARHSHQRHFKKVTVYFER